MGAQRNWVLRGTAATAGTALAVLAMGGEPVDVATIIRKLDVETMRRDALWALGFAGTVPAAEAALAWIADDALGKIAGESFATITGARISGPLAKVGQVDNSPPPQPEEDDEPVPALLPEDSLPDPNADRLLAWWKSAGARFGAEVRYLHGAPWSLEAVRVASVTGPTWRRRPWNMELAIQRQGDVDVRTWARRQLDRG